MDGIDLIVSGHSHTVLDQPQIVRGTPIVRAGYMLLARRPLREYTSHYTYTTILHVGHVQLLYDHDAGQVTEVEGFVVPAAQLSQPDPEVATH